MFGLRFSNDLIYKDEEGIKYVFVNDGGEPIMETDETKYDPEFSRIYLEDLLMDNKPSQINLENIVKRSIIKMLRI